VAGLVSTIVPDFTFTDDPAGRIACSVRRTGGRRSNRGSDRRLVTATSVRAHSSRRPGAGYRARRPGARAQPGAPDAYAPIWLLPRIVRTCHDTATRPRQNRLHPQRRRRRAHGGNLHPCRRKSVATAAFRRSPARLNHRHMPGRHQSPGPWRRNATPQQVSGTLVCSYGLAAVTWTTELTCSSATSMPIELGRRSTSSTSGGRRTPDVPRPGPPRRLPTPTRQTPRRRGYAASSARYRYRVARLTPRFLQITPFRLLLSSGRGLCALCRASRRSWRQFPRWPSSDEQAPPGRR
jgi:hypothetical protein